MKKANLYLVLGTLIIAMTPHHAVRADAEHAAAQDQSLSRKERMSLARDFLKKMRSGFGEADSFLNQTSGNSAKAAENILPEGEELLFEIFLTRMLKIDDSAILGEVHEGEIYLPLDDFNKILEFPIAYDAAAQQFEGWYIAENKNFTFDIATATVTTDNGRFDASNDYIIDDLGIVKVASEALEKWFNFNIEPDVSGLRLYVESDMPLPLQQRLNRQKKLLNVAYKRPEPELPLKEEPKQLIDTPFVDISTRSTYDKRGGADEGESRHNATIRTAGDFAYGTLFTQSQMDSENQLTNVRATYKQESLEPELLGPLKARKFEIGDILQTRLPIEDQIRQELGVRVTNVDPLRNFTNPTTAISGNLPPGWDVELYRGSVFLELQQVGEDGFYSFDDVALFSDDNVFRLVFYGPQGEVREEEVAVPVDINNLAEGQTTYDVSLSLNDRQTYRKNQSNDEDRGSPTLQAVVEKPVLPGTVASLGFRSNEYEGERDNVAYAGVSTIVEETLLNATVSSDDEADLAAELTARREFGEHQLFGRTEYRGDGYDTINSGEDTTELFVTQLLANGNLGVPIGQNPSYNASAIYTKSGGGNEVFDGNLGFSTRFKNILFNEQLNYRTGNSLADDEIEATTVLGGNFGKNRIRLTANYEVKPDNELERMLASYTYRPSNDLSYDFDVEHRVDPSVTEYSAQVNWQAGFARISPSIRYNTEDDFFAGLATNFGLLREPVTNSLYSFDRNITSNGAISVFVFLDADGDGTFTQGVDEALPEVSVRALQNGGLAVTDKKGVALFKNLAELKLTDVIVEEASLQDPYWIPGFEGASILPREGYIAELQFPIHNAGEIDGTLYLRNEAGETQPLKAVPLNLYNVEGEIEQTATTDFGGFYLFSKVPPGRYLLVVDHQAALNNNFSRPKPQQIEIGYDGTIIYGNDVYVEAGQKDVPSEILSDMTDYRERHPHIDFSKDEYNIVLNMGEFNSRLLMATQWYRLHTRYRPIIAGGELLVQPQDSYADPETGKHTLRIGYKNASLEDAYERCRALMSRNIDCLVEVYAGAYNSKIASTEPAAKKL